MDDSEHKKLVKEMGYSEFLKLQKADGLIFTKCSAKSTENRQVGNKILESKEFAKNGHGAEVHGLVLHYYSKSIALAPKESEELALGYDNRSALLKHVQKYKECIIDIERALGITKCDELKSKLEDRKKECLTLIKNYVLNNVEDIDDSFEKLQLPKLIPSKAIPSMVNSTKLTFNETYGRHIVATKDMEAGEIIAIEEGYVMFPSVEQQYHVCTHCLQLSLNAIPCDECACVIYCNERCKADALKEYHNVECNILPFFYGKQYEFKNLVHNLMTARLFITAVNKEGLENVIKDAKIIDSEKEGCIKGSFQSKVFSSHKFKSCYSLQSFEKVTKLSENNNFYCSMIFHALDEYTSIFKSLENGENVDEIKKYINELLVKLKNIIDVNFYYFQDFDCECSSIEMCYKWCDKISGSVLTPSCSFFNHSCIPNVSRVFTAKREIVLFTNRPVKEGDQLFVTYGPTVYMKKSKRQNILATMYNFTCQCEACIKDWPALLSEPESEEYEQNKRAFENYKDDELLKFCMKENIDSSKIYDEESGIYNEQLLKYYKKALEIIYEQNTSYHAHILAKSSTLYIERAFQKYYGLEYFMPDVC